ncbi:MAG: hypothetical protein U0Q18_01835 [Bryobacteraceae bacterium]
MRKIVLSSAFFTAFSVLAFAESWSGSLLDANCYKERKNPAACPATTATASFALSTSNKVYALDDNGNTKAAAVLKSRADRSTDENAQGTPGPITATVTGSRDGDTLQVDDVQVQ